MNCAICKHNDGNIYTSIPPKYRCKITGEYHESWNDCNVEFAPVKHAYWKKIGVSLYECSNCQKVAPYYTEEEHIVYWPELNYCPHCGAKMDDDENESC